MADLRAMLVYKITYSIVGGAVHHAFVDATTERAARSKLADATPGFRRILMVV